MEINLANYGQSRELNATTQELELFEHLKAICSDLELCRKSDSYLTATIHDVDVARFKFTPRAMWIKFPNVTDEKFTLSAPKDVEKLSDAIAESVAECNRIYTEYICKALPLVYTFVNTNIKNN